MKIRVEFIAHVRELTGTPAVDIEVPAPAGGSLSGSDGRPDDGETGAAVLDLLAYLENLFLKKNLRLLAHNALIKGLLVFKKRPKTGLTRIRNLQEHLESGEILVIGTGMEGG